MTAVLQKLVLATTLLLLSMTAQAAPPARIDVSLHARSQQPAPGKSVMLALRMVPKPGWHGYWSNPGDSGLPPKVRWTLPTGVKIGPLQHPAPELLRVSGMTSFVHGGEHVLLAPMQVAATIQPGERLPIEGKVDFLACSDTLCVPQSATVRLDLVAGNGALAPEEAALFAAARRALPTASNTIGSFIRDGSQLTLRVPPATQLDAARATFFPSGDGVFERRDAKRLDDGSLQITGTMASNNHATLAGVVGDGKRAIRLRFTQAAAPAASIPDGKNGESAGDSSGLSPDAVDAPSMPGPTLDVSPVADGAGAGLGWAIFGALVGGLLLNLMPCVFPILSLKAMHLARAGHSAAAARSDSTAYAAGALATSIALGLAILGLRNAGVAIGWSFQLQHPYVILALLLLVTAIAFNLAGLFHMSSRSIELGQTRSGHSGSFGTGAMAAFVATPCSAPFMASAVGAAMILPGWTGLLVFGALGLGLALPFLLIGWVPGVRKRLPRPGTWMLRLQRILSVPMFVTALGLAWVLGRQSGSDGMAIGLGATILLGLALWWTGARQRDGKRRSWLPLGPALLAAVGAASLVPAAAQSPPATSRANNVEPFSEQRLAQLRGARVPVFVDFTADWCLTCKVNEKVAIERDATREAFRRAGVFTLVGDWTSGDPKITAFLAKHQRNSIPFYLYYAPGQRGEVLPQILTTDLLVEKARSKN
ncbi:protein-disulfide reductase DsbD family protein [Sphingomonas edaphi]|uniref:Thiol:disulfide interchange protein n=1 Tax=Sphingomonas edaphi TaxID=2315689 RepID=A0A418PZ46_9SPHN|nr:thioredoxin family protein [Sphingomonas edaphi]RIX27433.1 thiol:disulfide interchange protein [Sphingomonas edaphi]